MDDLSLHILDIIENSVRADATRVTLAIEISKADNILVITIEDNGKGMDAEEIRQCENPFYTTKACKKTGLGISLLKQSALETDGSFSLRSEKGKGTSVTAEFQFDHIDRRPLGDIAKTFYLLIAAFPTVNLLLTFTQNGLSFDVDTAEIKKELEDIPINAPDVLKTLRKHITEGIRSVDKG